MIDPMMILREGLEEAAATFGLMEAVYKHAGERPLAEMMRTARNKCTAALDRAGFPYQEDSPRQKERP